MAFCDSEMLYYLGFLKADLSGCLAAQDGSLFKFV